MSDEKSRHNKGDMWALRRHLERSRSRYRLHATCDRGLQDAGGDPLPDAAKQFLIDLLFLKAKTKGKTHNYLPQEKIREIYKMRLFFEQQADPRTRLKGESPADVVKAKLPKEWLPKECKTTVPIIDQIVNPRKSRMPRKPRNA